MRSNGNVLAQEKKRLLCRKLHDLSSLLCQHHHETSCLGLQRFHFQQLILAKQQYTDGLCWLKYARISADAPMTWRVSGFKASGKFQVCRRYETMEQCWKINKTQTCIRDVIYLYSPNSLLVIVKLPPASLEVLLKDTKLVENHPNAIHRAARSSNWQP